MVSAQLLSHGLQEESGHGAALSLRHFLLHPSTQHFKRFLIEINCNNSDYVWCCLQLCREKGSGREAEHGQWCLKLSFVLLFNSSWTWSCLSYIGIALRLWFVVFFFLLIVSPGWGRSSLVKSNFFKTGGKINISSALRYSWLFQPFLNLVIKIQVPDLELCLLVLTQFKLLVIEVLRRNLHLGTIWVQIWSSESNLGELLFGSNWK